MSDDELDQERRERLRRFLEESTQHPAPAGFERRVMPHGRRSRLVGRTLGAATVCALVAAATVAVVVVTTGGRSGHRQTAVPPTPSPAIPSSTTISESGFYFVMGGTALESLAGGEWSVVATPTPAPVASQSGAQATPAPASIACPTPDDCWAVGDSYEDLGLGTGNGNGLIEHWDGSAWTIVSQPANGLASISCDSADDCWAVGGSSGDLLEPALEH